MVDVRPLAHDPAHFRLRVRLGPDFEPPPRAPHRHLPLFVRRGDHTPALASILLTFIFSFFAIRTMVRKPSATLPVSISATNDRDHPKRLPHARCVSFRRSRSLRNHLAI